MSKQTLKFGDLVVNKTFFMLLNKQLLKFSKHKENSCFLQSQTY